MKQNTIIAEILLEALLRKIHCYKQYYHYKKSRIKVLNVSMRIKFLEKCIKSDIIPRFLRFNIPNNGCFQQKEVHNFQKKL